MRRVSLILTSAICITVFTACQSQPANKNVEERKVGVNCEGCEAVYEYGNRKLNPVDTLPQFEENEPKLKITGTIYQNDGKTPAEGVILYIYHTDRSGVYPTKGGETGWARRHGYIRGWIKTDETGRYTFYTFRPASYPNTTVMQHIHATIKEPGYSEYYIDDFLFDDDPYLTESIRNRRGNRAGSGILKTKMENGMQVANRDLILGKNIPNYK